jgi:phosphoribosylglycinamide formyltransferase-1
MKRIVVLISGRGSNLPSIFEAAQREAWPARFQSVISTRPGVKGLEVAQRHGVPAQVVDHQAFADRAAFDAALAEAIDAHAPDLVVLAGFMRVLTAGFVERYTGRLVNIHPSLLPAFTGLHTHRRAIEAGCKFAGATVHFVTPVLDFGPIVAQAAVPVLPDDTEASLADRVLAAERRLYPLALRWIVGDALVIDRGVVRQRDGEPQWLV